MSFHAGHNALDAERLLAGSGEFDRKRYAIETAADVADARGIGITQLELFHRRGDALDEEARGRVSQHFGSAEALRRWRALQPMQAARPFTLDAQRLAAGRHDLYRS